MAIAANDSVTVSSSAALRSHNRNHADERAIVKRCGSQAFVTGPAIMCQQGDFALLNDVGGMIAIKSNPSHRGFPRRSPIFLSA
jgi:hypothetical protein